MILRIFFFLASSGLLGVGCPDFALASESADEHSHFVVVDRDGKYLGKVVEIEEGKARVDVLREINERVVLFSIIGQEIAGSYDFYLAYTTPDCSGNPHLPLPTKVSALVEQSFVDGKVLFFTAMDKASIMKEQGRKPMPTGLCFNLAQPQTSGSPYGALPGQSAETTIHAVPFSGKFDLGQFRAPFKVIAR
ncbi:MAG: hypothetical protein OEY57_10910 [Nitrospirota bacterium]|nr:hypothetical protein [Nitrospirota bacterium]